MEREALRGFIREQCVCWELAPRFEVRAHERVQVGYDLTLLARHPPSDHHPPGCEECYATYQTLREIARLVLPEGIHHTQCTFSAFDAAHHLRPQTRWTPEVELTIEITHREDTFRRADDEERQCGAEIQEALRRLGARPRVWSGAESFIGGR
jgi:hypothetical protein